LLRNGGMERHLITRKSRAGESSVEGILRPVSKYLAYTPPYDWLENPTATRAIGAANGRNPISIVVPCHRVIGASGKPCFAGGLVAKAHLLDLEASGSGLFAAQSYPQVTDEH
jgi:O-6-methylguanine DNA methyltransferase